MLKPCPAGGYNQAIRKTPKTPGRFADGRYSKHEPMTIPTYVPLCAAEYPAPSSWKRRPIRAQRARFIRCPTPDRLSNESGGQRVRFLTTLANEHVEGRTAAGAGRQDSRRQSNKQQRTTSLSTRNAVHQARHGGVGRPVGLRRRRVQLAPAPPPHHLHACWRPRLRKMPTVPSTCLDGRSRAFSPDAWHAVGITVHPGASLCGGQGRGPQPHRHAPALHVVE